MNTKLVSLLIIAPSTFRLKERTKGAGDWMLEMERLGYRTFSH
jgi:hypothetical protein